MKKEKISWFVPWHPYPFSVSKINQILSFFVALLFILLTASTLVRYHHQTPPLDWLAVLILVLTVLTVLLLCWKGSTDLRDIPETGSTYGDDFELRSARTDVAAKPKTVDPKKIVRVRVGRRVVEIVDPPANKTETT